MPSPAPPQVFQRVLRLLLVASFLLALPAVAGQGLEPFGVAIETDANTRTQTTTEDCVAFQGTIRNTGQSPVPPQHQIDITLSAQPQGWSLTPPATTRFNLAPGATGAFSFQLCPEEGLEDGATGVVTVTAVVTSDLRGEPARATERFTAEYGNEGVFGFDLPDAAVYVAIAAVLGLLGIVLLTRRRPAAGIVVACPEPAKEVLPNRGTSFPIRVRNEGRARDVVTLTTSPVPRGWDTFLPLVDIPLEPREEQTVWLSVKSPPDAQPGDHVVVKIIARSAAGGAESAEIDTLTTVREPDAPAPARMPAGPQPITFEEEVAMDADEERSVYGPEDSAPAPSGRPVAVKRRRSS